MFACRDLKIEMFEINRIGLETCSLGIFAFQHGLNVIIVLRTEPKPNHNRWIKKQVKWSVIEVMFLSINLMIYTIIAIKLSHLETKISHRNNRKQKRWIANYDYDSYWCVCVCWDCNCPVAGSVFFRLVYYQSHFCESNFSRKSNQMACEWMCVCLCIWWWWWRWFCFPLVYLGLTVWPRSIAVKKYCVWNQYHSDTIAKCIEMWPKLSNFMSISNLIFTIVINVFLENVYFNSSSNWNAWISFLVCSES